MKNKVNIPIMLDLLRKSTCNYSIDSVCLTFDVDKYNVGMRGTNCIIMLNGENDVISGIKDSDTWELNFSDPSKNVKTYFDLIIPDEDGNADITMKEEKIILKSGNQKSNLFFCSDTLVSRFDGSGPKTIGDELFETVIDQELIDTYSLIKKVASSFGKIYFSVKDGKLFMEGTDKTNSFSNGMSMEIGDSDYTDVDLCFEFKTFNNFMTLINGDFADFTIRVGYIKKNNGGMISLINDDKSEVYYLLSTRENTQ